MFNKALDSKLYYLEQSGAYTHAFYDAVVFKKLRALLGGRVQLLITGSAPIDGKIISFLKVVFSCPFREGFGQTETSAPATLAKSEDGASGHVGGPLTCCKARLRDIPEMSYLSTDENPRGELLLKGPSIFKGYFKDPEKTKEAFDE
jgi:long-chain acyl-CoA synthetase